MSVDLEDLEKKNEERRERKRASSRVYREANKKEIAERWHLKMETDPEFREKELARRRRTRRKQVFAAVYGISLADYDLMFQRQGGACALCKKKSNRTLCVDHCHVTKGVRALLCHGCNSMLGFSGDDPDLLDAGSAYLRAHRARLRAAAADSGTLAAKDG
jgi:hypothetical protein